MTQAEYELALADLIDMLARGYRQAFHGDEPTAWRPNEVPER